MTSVASADTAPRVFRVDGDLPARDGLIRIGTRGSKLAVAQTTTVAEQIARATGTEVALIIITTQGDVSRAPLAQLGGTGVFVSALRDALLEGRCDVAVHSLKDLPTAPCPGIALGAVPPRADARDAFCARDGLTLDTLPAGAHVGTGSPRRAAQVRARRPDLEVHGIRGNVDTRLGRVGVDLDAVVLAAAGLDRLGRGDVITERFSLDTMPGAPGQGALAIEVRESSLADPVIALALADLDDAETHACAIAERSLLGALEAGCAAPVGAWARREDDVLVVTAAVYREDGSESLVRTRRDVAPSTDVHADTDADAGDSDSDNTDPGADPLARARALGAALAHDLLESGAGELAQLGATAR